MTAIVGILNKRAAVMAADSAVTVTKGEKTKIYNTATKIFRLSLKHPIGVMIFSSVEFMGTPWDVIFKLYRDHRGDQSFNTLKEYAQNFVDFLNAENYFSSVNSQKDYFINELSRFYYTVKDEAIDGYQKKKSSLEEEADNVDDEEMFRSELKRVLDKYSHDSNESKVNKEFEDYTIENLRSYGSKEFDELMNLCEEEEMPTDMRKEWEECFLAYLRHECYYFSGTGIVFVGYGSKDIYPSLLPVFISGAFDHRLRYYFDEDPDDSITNDNRARIRPFAQLDVMLTLMKGIAPNMQEMVVDAYHTSTQATKQKMINAMKEAGASKKMLEQMEEVDVADIQKECEETLQTYIQEEYVEGIIDAVDSFSIDDMANMAESLVGVTNLQRHITSSDESVGGPIDVAVITRSEGFIWIKHKEWFKQELNPHTQVYE